MNININSTNSTEIIGKTKLAALVTDALKAKHNVSFSRKHSLLMLETIGQEIINALVIGQKVKLMGYWSLETAWSKPRIAVNLRTHKKMQIPTRRVIRVRISSIVKQKVANSPLSSNIQHQHRETRRG